ncbi:MAG: hypothetical protein HKN48_03050, partial [Flavobacteriaceae bacterium]|nr:hypothetical protein [Flavobacteriaceae bacterium]
MRSFLLLLCIFFSNLSLQSQDTITNTVEKQRVDSLLALAKTYYKTHLDSAEYYLDLVQKDIDAIQDIEIKATSNIIRSDVLLQ